MTNRILILLHGESFRFTPQMTRGVCKNDSKIRQNMASLSHNKFIDNLKKLGYDVDLIINVHTLPNEYKQYLLYLYSGCNVIRADFNENIYSEFIMLNNSYDKFNLTVNDCYNYFFMFRIDLYLKKYFINNIKLSDTNIIVPHPDYHYNTSKQICQQLIFFPKKLFYVIKTKLIYTACHDLFSRLKANNIHNLDFYVYSTHICSSDLGWNPIYIQVGRNYNKDFFYNDIDGTNYYDIINAKCLVVNHNELFNKSQIDEDDYGNVKIKYFNTNSIYKNIYDYDENNRIINIYKFSNTNLTGVNLYYPNILLVSDNEHFLPVIEKTMSLNMGTIYEKNNMETQIKIPQGGGGCGSSIPINEIYKIDTYLKGNYFYFIYNTDNYFHFVYDSLPYLISYFKLKKDIHDLKLLMQYPNPEKNIQYPFVTEMLELIGIFDKDVEMLNSSCKYEHIFVSTSYTHDFDSNLPPRREIYEFYQNISKKALNIYKNETPPKIYISRRTHLHNDLTNIGTNYTQRRKLVNEDEVVDNLIKEGYVELFTECLSTIEKIAYFANSTHIVGCIGGGIVNVLFSKPNTKLIAIVSPTFLEVNKRFKYSIGCVDVKYDYNTKHIETGIYKKYMRVNHKHENIIGEIIEVKQNSVVIQSTNGSNTGWNATNTYKTIELNNENINRLDNGLNSPYIYIYY